EEKRGQSRYIHRISLDKHLRALLDQIGLDPGEQTLHRNLAFAVLGRDLHLVHLGGVFQEQLQPAPVTPKTSSARQEPRSRRLKRQGKRNREENERCWKTDYPNSRVR